MSKPSIVRRLLRWFFDGPTGSPWVSLNVSVGVDGSEAYLAKLRETALPHLTMHHLLLASIGRALRDFPQANRRLVGSRLVPVPEVSIAMPVNLLGYAGESQRELSLALLPEADRLSLGEVAQRLGRILHGERKGKSHLPHIQLALAVADLLPDPILYFSLDAASSLLRIPALDQAFFRRYPFTAFVTNLGAAVREGRQLPITYRGGSMVIPTRPFRFSTFWGAGPIQEEVVAVEGAPTVRRSMPLAFLFDHRVIDGVIASRLLLRFTEILSDPEPVFGADGERGAEA